MPIGTDLLTQVTTAAPQEAWQAISDYLWEQFSAPIPASAADSEVVRRDKDLNELDNVLSGSAWELWNDFESSIPKATDSLVEFWEANPEGRAILILDGLSLRESPWLLTQASLRGAAVRWYKLRNWVFSDVAVGCASWAAGRRAERPAGGACGSPVRCCR